MMRTWGFLVEEYPITLMQHTNVLGLSKNMRDFDLAQKFGPNGGLPTNNPLCSSYTFSCAEMTKIFLIVWFCKILPSKPLALSQKGRISMAIIIENALTFLYKIEG